MHSSWLWSGFLYVFGGFISSGEWQNNLSLVDLRHLINTPNQKEVTSNKLIDL